MSIYFIIVPISIILSVWIIRLKKRVLLQKQKIENFDYFIDNVPLLVDSFDAKGKCTIWNKECERVFGWSIDEINAVENPMALFYPDEEDQKETLEKLQNITSNQLIEVYPQTKEGKVIISVWAVVSIENSNSIAIGYDNTHENLDRIKERTLQLNETKQKLAELNTSLERRVEIELQKNKEHQKMMIIQSRHAQMGETLSMIAHQWRQPLNNLSLIIQDAVFEHKMGKFNDITIQTLDKESFNQIQQMSQTITDFKNFFKADKELTKINMAEAISHALSIIEPTLEDQNILLKSTLEENIFIVGYPSEFGQSIINIIVNAKDALLDNKIKNGSISISLISTKEQVSIEIEDNGGGIPMEIIDNIFDPYFSTKGQKNGTGLGLYISKIIIENHMNGNLSIHNRGDGVVCIITFDNVKSK